MTLHSLMSLKVGKSTKKMSEVPWAHVYKKGHKRRPKYYIASEETLRRRANSMPFHLVNCESMLLREIADKQFTRDQVAVTYGLAIRSKEVDDIDWAKVNRAIIERWSASALDYIKGKAWKG